MIEAIRGKGANRAKVTCDDCSRVEVMACGYIRGRTPESTEVNAGQLHQKLIGQGWSVIGSKLHCPACSARNRASARQKKDEAAMVQDAPVAQVDEKSPSQEPPREPGYRMIGMICDMLNVAYDRAAKRYSNPADNDRTIAEAIGEGCMWGWVARIREAEYGPDTRWVEIDAIRDELAQAIRDADGRANDAEARIKEATAVFEAAVEKISTELIGRIEALQKRVNALDPAIGPRAGKVRK